MAVTKGLYLTIFLISKLSLSDLSHWVMITRKSLGEHTQLFELIRETALTKDLGELKTQGNLQPVSTVRVRGSLLKKQCLMKLLIMQTSRGETPFMVKFFRKTCSYLYNNFVSVKVLEILFPGLNESRNGRFFLGQHHQTPELFFE